MDMGEQLPLESAQPFGVAVAVKVAPEAAVTANV